MPLAKKRFSILLAAFLLLSPAACSAPETATVLPSPTAGVTLTPFVPQEPGGKSEETPAPPRSPTPPPTPTPTPFTYTIVKDDTLIGVAFRFGLTLEELLAANPGIDPQFLTIGETLIVPLPENPAPGAGLPTPVGEVAAMKAPVCYPLEDASLWCFALFENKGLETVENIAAQISVYDAAGELLLSGPAITPVNLLPGGQSVPVAAWFPGIGPDYGQASAVLTSAIPVAEGDARYVEVESRYEINLHGDAAEVRGEVIGAFREARIGVTALGTDGQVLGVRVLLLPGDLSIAAAVAFSLDLFSLGGDIDTVTVLVEAYP